MKNLIATVGIVVVTIWNPTDKWETGAVSTRPEGSVVSKTAAAVLKANGQIKWKTDTATHRNVQALKSIAGSFKKTTPALPDYQALAADFQQGLNTMIKECRMKGKAHDALHGWLAPFIAEVKTLNNAASVNRAARSLENIRMQLAVYDQSFEL